MASGRTYILGLSAFYHDSAAALLQDGTIVAAAQEERFTREKGDARFPSRAIAYCLKEAAVGLDEVDYVVFYEKPLVKFERLLETYLAFVPHGFESFQRAFPRWAKHKLRLPEYIRAELGETFHGNSCSRIITRRMPRAPSSHRHLTKRPFSSSMQSASGAQVRWVQAAIII